MSPEMEALKANPGVVASVIAAAVAFTLFCLVGVAVLLGWIGPGVRPLVSSSTPARAPASPPPTPDGLGLAPGETLVAAAEPPKASAAPAPAPAPAATPPSPAPRKVVTEPKRPRKPHASARAANEGPQKDSGTAAAQESAPQRLAQAPHPSDPTDPWPQPACGSCGVVHSITVFPDLWEVRVRFDDGGRRTIRYHKPPRWRVGDRIRYDDGRLVRE